MDGAGEAPAAQDQRRDPVRLSADGSLSRAGRRNFRRRHVPRFPFLMKATSLFHNQRPSRVPCILQRLPGRSPSCCDQRGGWGKCHTVMAQCGPGPPPGPRSSFTLFLPSAGRPQANGGDPRQEVSQRLYNYLRIKIQWPPGERAGGSVAAAGALTRAQRQEPAKASRHESWPLHLAGNAPPDLDAQDRIFQGRSARQD